MELPTFILPQLILILSFQPSQLTFPIAKNEKPLVIESRLEIDNIIVIQLHLLVKLTKYFWDFCHMASDKKTNLSFLNINNINNGWEQISAQFSNSKLPVPSLHAPLRCPAFSTHKYGGRGMMRFTDKKGIKIYCCVSFSPCKVWIKCQTLAYELLNELVCSLRCGACKYPSWV